MAGLSACRNAGGKMFKRVSKAGFVAAASASLIMVFASTASANWSSYISNWDAGQESRRWSDESYSETHFTHCANNQSIKNTTISLFRVVDNSPDVQYDNKTFTACFSWGDGDETSTGSWSGLPKSTASWDGDEYKGGYYFKVLLVGNNVGTGTDLDVSTVSVDTTLAD